MLAVYTLSSKKRNVLVDPNKYEYNLQSMSREKSKSFCVEKGKHSKCVATAVVKEKNFTAWGNWCWGSWCWENWCWGS